MSKKKKNVVYSTNPNYNYEYEGSEGGESLAPGQQQLRIYPDRRNRKGKTVTVITGFQGSTDDIKSLEKSLKSACGTGGTVKNGDILIQGDFVKKVADLLEKEGYRYKISGV